MTRYIITGGSGFLGTEIIRELLKAGERSIVVIDLVKPQIDVEFKFADITQPLNFTFTPDDILLHLAARQYHGKIPRENRKAYFLSVNAYGTEKLLEKSFQDGCRKMVFFSTDMVYGKPNFLPVTVEHPLAPFDCYGESKKIAEDHCCSYRKKGYNITIFRPRMIIGKGRLGILKKLFTLIRHNLPVPMIGPGTNCYQMISVNDCARATMLAISKRLPNSNYNLGSLNPPSIHELLKNLIHHVGSKSLLMPTNGVFIKTVLAFLGTVGIELMYREQYMIADENYILDIEKTTHDLEWVPKDDDTSMLLEAYNEYIRQQKL